MIGSWVRPCGSAPAGRGTHSGLAPSASSSWSADAVPSRTPASVASRGFAGNGIMSPSILGLRLAAADGSTGVQEVAEPFDQRRQLLVRGDPLGRVGAPDVEVGEVPAARVHAVEAFRAASSTSRSGASATTVDTLAAEDL